MKRGRDLAELLAQCEKAHARAHVAHIKVVLGKGEDRGKALLGRLEAARAKGLEVTADIYPYTELHDRRHPLSAVRQAAERLRRSARQAEGSPARAPSQARDRSQRP